jgi:putative PIN family toxin of toxin-antitoxin system
MLPELKGVHPLRVVFDTNVVVSSLFWNGTPFQLLEAVRNGRLDLATSLALLAELRGVLARSKFVSYLKEQGETPTSLAAGFALFCRIASPGPIPPTVLQDPDDDAVLACAISAEAQAIVTGDKHLLALREFQGIKICSAAELLRQLQEP